MVSFLPPISWKSMVQGCGTFGKLPSAQGKGNTGISWAGGGQLCVGIL